MTFLCDAVGTGTGAAAYVNAPMAKSSQATIPPFTPPAEGLVFYVDFARNVRAL